MQTTTLITLDDSTEAHLIKGRLANEGIECFLTNENYTGLYPGRNNWFGHGIQIMVDKKDEEKAREVIQDTLEQIDEELICPYCKSTDIVVSAGGNSLFRLLSVLGSLLAAFPHGTPKPKYYCKRCGNKV